ncbi:MAG: putative dehydrogenase [Alteromonas macleodii]|jgi:putative dehydrogenase
MLIDFVGLGSMGLGMATSLLKVGHDVRGYDPDMARIEMLCAQGGVAYGDPKAPPVDAIVCVVLHADQTRDVLFGEQGVAAQLCKGGVIISCATVSPAFASEMEIEAFTHGHLYLDAPISGGAIKAAEGRLSIMASGTAEAFTAADPLLDAMSETIHHLGDRA